MVFMHTEVREHEPKTAVISLFMHTTILNNRSTFYLKLQRNKETKNFLFAQPNLRLLSVIFCVPFMYLFVLPFVAAVCKVFPSEYFVKYKRNIAD